MEKADSCFRGSTGPRSRILKFHSMLGELWITVSLQNFDLRSEQSRPRMTAFNVVTFDSRWKQEPGGRDVDIFRATQSGGSRLTATARETKRSEKDSRMLTDRLTVQLTR